MRLAASSNELARPKGVYKRGVKGVLVSASGGLSKYPKRRAAANASWQINVILMSELWQLLLLPLAFQSPPSSTQYPIPSCPFSTSPLLSSVLKCLALLSALVSWLFALFAMVAISLCYEYAKWSWVSQREVNLAMYVVCKGVWGERVSSLA